MLSFSAITLEDRETLEPLMQQDGVIASIRTFASLFIWGEHYQTCFCMENGTLFFKDCNSLDRLTYHMPLGGDLEAALSLIEQDAAMQGLPYEITWVTEEGRAAMEQAAPGRFRFEELRADFEYIYNAEDMIGLRGKKYHGKRNFINRFLMAYGGRWDYAPVDPVADYDDILAFVCKWCEEQEGDTEDYRYEYSAIVRALKHYEELGIRGGVLRLDDKLIAFTLAVPQNETAMDILIEKAEYDIDGAYPMINQQFATLECQGFRYINREEDMGIEGLRQAKMSYHPAFLTAKYRAVPLS